ncbi:MAG: flavin reductase [Clostridia bacterium]|nr:flavin reductase [Clostridia bacterium]
MREISPREIDKNAIKLISEDWALLTAGSADGWNTMTVSWGGIGELWGKDVAFVFVRPQRYTKEFIDNSEYFTLSFFDDSYKGALRVCGAKSGRDIDKSKEAGITPVFENGTAYLEQANLVLLCKKLYSQDMTPDCFLDKSIITDNYKANDFHTTYVGEIIKVLKKD